MFGYHIPVYEVLFQQSTETPSVQTDVLHYGKNSCTHHVTDFQQFLEAFHMYVRHKDVHCNK